MKKGVVLRYLKGTIFYANLEPKIGSEQGGIRPVIVVQTDKGNWKNPTVIIAPLTKKINNKPNLPSHINIKKLGIIFLIIAIFCYAACIVSSRCSSWEDKQ